MRHTFDIITADAEALRKAVREADRAMSARAGDHNAEPVYLAGKVSEKSRPIVYHALKNAPFKSEVTGANVTRYTGEVDDIKTVIHDQIDTTLAAQMPLGYLIPAAPPGKIAYAARTVHGVEITRTEKPLDQASRPTASPAPNLPRMRERRPRDVDSRTKNRRRRKSSSPAGSYWVPMKQRRARLILSPCSGPERAGFRRSLGASDGLGFEGRRRKRRGRGGGVGECCPNRSRAG